MLGSVQAGKQQKVGFTLPAVGITHPSPPFYPEVESIWFIWGLECAVF